MSISPTEFSASLRKMSGLRRTTLNRTPMNNTTTNTVEMPTTVPRRFFIALECTYLAASTAESVRFKCNLPLSDFFCCLVHISSKLSSLEKADSPRFKFIGTWSPYSPSSACCRNFPDGTSESQTRRTALLAILLSQCRYRNNKPASQTQ